MVHGARCKVIVFYRHTTYTYICVYICILYTHITTFYKLITKFRLEEKSSKEGKPKKDKFYAPVNDFELFRQHPVATVFSATVERQYCPSAGSIWFETWESWIRVKNRFFQTNLRKISIFKGISHRKFNYPGKNFLMTSV